MEMENISCHMKSLWQTFQTGKKKNNENVIIINYKPHGYLAVSVYINSFLQQPRPDTSFPAVHTFPK